MDQQPTRVAVVGTGAWWGREHARVFSSRPDVDLCAGRRALALALAIIRSFETGTRVHTGRDPLPRP